MDVQTIADTLGHDLARWIVGRHIDVIDPWIEVAPDGLTEVCRALRDRPALRMNMLHCITGVDYFEPNEKKAARVDWQPHIELIYHLSSLVHKHRIVLKVSVPRWKDSVEGALPEVPSVADIWSTAVWHEREVFDLVGVRFTGHPDLRRILCPEDWEGYPLRKDYSPPSEYHGIRVK